MLVYARFRDSFGRVHIVELRGEPSKFYWERGECNEVAFCAAAPSIMAHESGVVRWLYLGSRLPFERFYGDALVCQKCKRRADRWLALYTAALSQR